MIVKICGIRSTEELDFVERYADFTGVVMDRNSRRYTGIERAREIIEASTIPVFAVLTSSSFDDAYRIAEQINAEYIQIHSENFGIEDFSMLKEHGLVTAKAFRISKSSQSYTYEAEIVLEMIRQYSPDFSLLDTGKGSGEMHDLRVSREIAKKEKIMLAGGLNPENARSVIEFVKPAGVDVSSGVERNGRKDYYLVKKFSEVVRGDGC